MPAIKERHKTQYPPHELSLVPEIVEFEHSITTFTNGEIQPVKRLETIRHHLGKNSTGAWVHISPIELEQPEPGLQGRLLELSEQDVSVHLLNPQQKDNRFAPGRVCFPVKQTGNSGNYEIDGMIKSFAAAEGAWLQAEDVAVVNGLPVLVFDMGDLENEQRAAVLIKQSDTLFLDLPKEDTPTINSLLDRITSPEAKDGRVIFFDTSDVTRALAKAARARHTAVTAESEERAA